MTGQHPIDVHVLLLDGDRVLLSRRRDGDAGFDGRWHAPAGRLEHGESAPAGAAREALEEVGVVIDPRDLDLVHTCHVTAPGRVGRLGLFFATRRWSGTPVNREPGKCSGIAWFPVSTPPGDMIPYPAAGLRGLRENVPFSLLGWPDHDGE